MIELIRNGIDVIEHLANVFCLNFVESLFSSRVFDEPFVLID